MSGEILTISEAAARLGITTATLYDWLGQSDVGLLKIRGRSMTVSYFQGGPKGQGRIRIPAAEVDQLLDAMRVTPSAVLMRRMPPRPKNFPGITVPLGRPDH